MNYYMLVVKYDLTTIQRELYHYIKVKDTKMASISCNFLWRLV